MKKPNNIEQQKINSLKDNFQFDVSKHILTFESLYLKLNQENDIDKISQVEKILEKELDSLICSNNRTH